VDRGGDGADLFAMMIGCRAASYICNGGVTAFGARIVSSFGYTSLQTILLLIPGGAMTVVSSSSRRSEVV
jgi:hypothetical protein